MLSYGGICVIFLLTLDKINRICPLQDDWWRHMLMYEVYVQSFKDSDGDGLGDLKGITDKMDYLADLGVEAIWLTPFFDSPMEENGYDIRNFTAINPMFGKMSDFDALMKQAKTFGIKIFIDLVLNHCSVEHEFFKKSVEKIEPYTDYFVWHDPKGWDNNKPIPPNNWLQLSGGSAWTWNEKRRQFYYHVFLWQQPDFNMRNAKVLQEFKSIIKFWLDKGVDGFRMDAIQNFVEDAQFRDELYVSWEAAERKSDKFHDLWHSMTYDQPETIEVLHELREYIDGNYDEKNGGNRVMVLEIYDGMNTLLKFYDRDNYKISHFPFYFYMLGGAPYPSSQTLEYNIHTIMDAIDEKKTPNWVIENHDMSRVAFRFGPEYVDIYIITLLMLPGVVCSYYGFELGMSDMAVRPDQRTDKMHPQDIQLGYETRDTRRLPMQWDNSTNAGFTANKKAWLPVNSDYWFRNVKTQNESKESHYHIYKDVAKLRRTSTRKFGKLTTYNMSDYTYAYSRTLANSDTYIVVLNLGTETEKITLPIDRLPDELEVIVASLNSEYKKQDVIDASFKSGNGFYMRPKSALLLTPFKKKLPTTTTTEEPTTENVSTTTTTTTTTSASVQDVTITTEENTHENAASSIKMLSYLLYTTVGILAVFSTSPFLFFY